MVLALGTTSSEGCPFLGPPGVLHCLIIYKEAVAATLQLEQGCVLAIC